jgi:hypothetical protein
LLSKVVLELDEEVEAKVVAWEACLERRREAVSDLERSLVGRGSFLIGVRRFEVMMVWEEL